MAAAVFGLAGPVFGLAETGAVRFAGLDFAATAAIVAEFVGANKGLGYVLLRGTSTMDIELVFAVLVVLTLVGIVINYVVELSEWAMTPWQRASNT